MLAVKDSLVIASQITDYFDQRPFHIGVGANAEYFFGHFLTAVNSEEELEECGAHLFEIITID